MRRVAASEFDLLTITRALVGQLGERAVEPLLRQASKRSLPRGIGPTAAALLEQMLARGAVVGAYPYDFANVGELGYGPVSVTLLSILGFGVVVAAAYWGLDVLLKRVPGRRPVTT